MSTKLFSGLLLVSVLSSASAAAAQIVREPTPAIGAINFPQRERSRQRQPPILATDARLVEPDNSEKIKYRQLLGQRSYELAKILEACATQPTSRDVVNVGDDCSNSLPGGGSSYSFRQRRHVESTLSDIKVRDGLFVVGGSLTQGLIVSIGPADIAKIEMETPGVSNLSQFQPALTRADAQRQTREINSGIADGEFALRASVPIKLNETYAMRSIAYKVNTETNDKRRDLIIVFTVVQLDESGNVTLLWKELRNIDAPKLETEK